MRRILACIVFLFFFSSLFFAPSIVFSQEIEESEYRKAFANYSLTFEQYKSAHSEYVLARAQYLRFNTLQSKTNAREATQAMLEARDEVIIIYFTALRKKLEETPGIDDDRLNALYFRIDEEQAWFSEHKERLSTAGTPEDLVEDSKEARGRFDSIEPLFYEILSTIASGKVKSFRERLVDIFTVITAKVNEIKSEEREEYSFSAEKFRTIDRWNFETENRVSRSEEKQIEASDLISQFREKRRGRRRVDRGQYNSVLLKLGESRQYLKEASSFLIEIVREIKTGE